MGGGRAARPLPVEWISAGAYDASNRLLTLQGPVEFFDANCTVVLSYSSVIPFPCADLLLLEQQRLGRLQAVEYPSLRVSAPLSLRPFVGPFPAGLRIPPTYIDAPQPLPWTS